MTDYFGNIFHFATDTPITIETLPKYGELFVASTAEEAGEAAAVLRGNSAGDISVASQLLPAEGYDRFVGACPVASAIDQGDASRRCNEAFGVGPSLSTRALGPVAARNRIPASSRGRPNVWYFPKEGYLGPDDFGFSVTVGGVKSMEAWVVGLHTRR